jgi:hypothetical protein
MVVVTVRHDEVEMRTKRVGILLGIDSAPFDRKDVSKPRLGEDGSIPLLTCLMQPPMVMMRL